jgi:transcriptional regulator with XRE-family HTH domain
VEVVAIWTGGRISALRAASRLTVEAFAAKLGIAPRTVAKWEADEAFVPPPGMQQILDAALAQASDEVRVRFRLLSVAVPAASLQGPGAGTAIVHVQAADARDVEAAADAADVDRLRLDAEPSPATIEVLWTESLEIARAANRSACDVFAEAQRVRRHALEMAERVRRPRDLADVYVVVGQATALMASTAFDLHHWDASARLARSATSYATLVGHASLQAWTFGLAALLANWRNEPDVALTHFHRGMEVAPAGAPRVRLRHIAARSYALVGDASSVAGVLEQARDDQGEAEHRSDPLTEEVGGEFAFSRARANACAAAAWLDLNMGHEAITAAQAALDELSAIPVCLRPVSQVSGASIDLATAYLLSGDLDRAGMMIGEILAASSPLANASLSGRLIRARSTLGSGRWAADKSARQLAEAIDGVG